MHIHAIQTGTVAIKTRQLSGRGRGALRPYITILDTTWTEPLPIYAWVIEHPQGLIVVDTGETARVAEPGYFPCWPTWFAPRLIDFAPHPFGPFPNSYPLTRAGDVHLVSTAGHTSGHYSVIVQEDEHALFFAGDTSYTQQLLLEHAVDGVTRDVALYQQTSQQIRTYLQSVPTIYLPSHDPEAAHRLATRNVAVQVNA